MIKRSRKVYLAPVLLGLFAGCNNSPLGIDAGVDASMMVVDMSMDLRKPVVPDLSPPERAATDHPPFPLLTNHGGTVLKNAEMWTVVWPGDEALGTRVERFHAWMLQSDYWTSSLGQYGVGPGVSKGVIVLSTPAPQVLTPGAIDAIADQLIKQHPADKNTDFVFVVPATSTVNGGQGFMGCQDFGGYHTQSQEGIVYEVGLQCPGGGPNGAFGSLTYTLSHEAAEAATDARPDTNQAWFNDDFPMGVSEVGDLCDPLGITEAATFNVADGGVPVGGSDGGLVDAGEAPDLAGVPVDVSYRVTRLWSNQAAMAGNSPPCVPVPEGQIFFGVGVSPAVITITTDNKGNGKQAILFEPWAFGDVGLINWQVQSQIQGVDVEPSSGQNAAGDTIPATITITADAPSGAIELLVFARAQQENASNIWYMPITLQ